VFVLLFVFGRVTKGYEEFGKEGMVEKFFFSFDVRQECEIVSMDHYVLNVGV